MCATLCIILMWGRYCIMLRNDDTIVSQINFYSFGGKEVLKYCLSLQGANMKQ